jgi:hypothetical protein
MPQDPFPDPGPDFDGFELAEPGLTHVTRWRGDDLDEKMSAAGQ